MPKNIRVNDQQSRSLQLSWTQPYAGNSAITNYIIQYKLVSGRVSFYPTDQHSLFETNHLIVSNVQKQAVLKHKNNPL